MEWSWLDVLVHVLIYPLYQVLSTARHELAHAAAAKLSGMQVLEIRLLPHRRDGLWYWGWVSWRGEPNVHCHLAPYYVNLTSLPFGIWLALSAQTWPSHVWAALVVMLLISPVVDTIYNLLKWRLAGRGDFAKAFSRER